MHAWTVTIGTLNKAPTFRPDSAMNQKDARREFAALCDHAARHAMPGTVRLWYKENVKAEFDCTGEPAKFLAYCLARVHLDEFWQRLAGSVRKAGTM